MNACSMHSFTLNFFLSYNLLSIKHMLICALTLPSYQRGCTWKKSQPALIRSIFCSRQLLLRVTVPRRLPRGPWGAPSPICLPDKGRGGWDRLVVFVFTEMLVCNQSWNSANLLCVIVAFLFICTSWLMLPADCTKQDRRWMVQSNTWWATSYRDSTEMKNPQG